MTKKQFMQLVTMYDNHVARALTPVTEDELEKMRIEFMELLYLNSEDVETFVKEVLKNLEEEDK